MEKKKRKQVKLERKRIPVQGIQEKKKFSQQETMEQILCEFSVSRHWDHKRKKKEKEIKRRN